MYRKKMLVILPILLITGLIYFQPNSNHKLDDGSLKVSTQSKLNTDEILEHDIKEKPKQRPKLDETLLHIAQLISPPSDQELKDTWKYEYTCYEEQECYANARFYEDALWLKRKGYPTRSMIELLQDVSIRDLSKLSNNGNVNASSLLAIHAMNKKDYKRAKSFARSASANVGRNSRETFGYRMLGEALIHLEKPMVATLYLRIASILGDTNASALYERITVNSASLMIDGTNEMAYGYLLSWLNTDIGNLNNDPRPTGSGGG